MAGKNSTSVNIKYPSLASNFEISSCMKIFQKFCGKKFVSLRLKNNKYNFQKDILWEEHLNLEKQESLNVGVTWPEPLPV